jgi:hypothetical protein
MRTFKEILSELGEALDAKFASIGSIQVGQAVYENVPTPSVPTPIATIPTNPTGSLFVGEPTMTSSMRQIIKLGVTANGGQYRVIVFDDGMMRVYQSVQRGYKQVAEGSIDTPKSGMSAYFTHGFMKENLDKVLWNIIGAKVFQEEIK